MAETKFYHECLNHYYCECGRFDAVNRQDARPCHYCRKQNYMFKVHFICIPCRIGFKSKQEPRLIGSVDNSQLRTEQPLVNHQDHYCPRCGQRATQVNRDFRVPKRNDQKSWTNIHKLLDQLEAVEKDGFFGNKMPPKDPCPSDNKLYAGRIKKPWTIKQWRS